MTLDPHWLDLADRLQRRTFPIVRRPATPLDAASVAFHEAGHVVLGELIGRPAAGATIEPIAGAAGYVWHGDVRPTTLAEPLPILPAPIMPMLKRDCFLIASARYAGLQAEFLLHDVDPAGLIVGDSHDDQSTTALLALGFAHVENRSTPRGGAQAFARALLQAHWPLVEALADALLEHGTLTGDQIKRILNRGCATAARNDPLSRRAGAPGALRAEPLRGMAGG